MYYVITPTSNDIQHHGILGMKWGRRNGPPYPLSASDHSASEKKARWRLSLGKKADKTKKKKNIQNEQTIPQKGTQEYEQQKQDALERGKASDILKYKGDLTNDQLQRAVNRIRLETQLAEYSSNETTSTWNKIDKTMDKVNKINNWTTTGLNTINNAEKVYNKLFNENSHQQNQPKKEDQKA